MTNVVTEYVVPVLGICVATAMFMSPLRAVYQVHRSGVLGDLNALPFAFILANCSSWTIYSFVVKDYFVFFSNWPGLCLSIFFCLTTYGLAKHKIKLYLLSTILTTVSIEAIGGLISVQSSLSRQQLRLMWGWITVTFLTMFYGAPLSEVYKVFKEKNSSYILRPLAFASLMNALLWFTYGLTVHDSFIYVPNGIGVVFSTFQLSLSCAFKPKAVQDLVGPRFHIDETQGILQQSELNGAPSSNALTEDKPWRNTDSI